MDIPTIIELGRGKKTLTAFAKELEVSHSILSLIRNKRRMAGGKVIKALARHPATKEAMLTFLAQNVTSDNDTVSVVDSKTAHDRN